MAEATSLNEARKRQRAAGDSAGRELSDDVLADEFSARYAADLRYVAAWGRWLEWRGTHWRRDDTLHVFDLVRAVCRERAAGCKTTRDAVAVASATKVAAVERLARADRRHAATVATWDVDPWLLNTPAGTVDLRTSELREHRRDDHLTKTTAAVPEGDCPTWRAFLEVVTGGDGELQLFLQRLAGYCLTGETREHAMFFLYGTGANGKSTFVDTLATAFGDYATTAPMETFLATRGEHHPTELAGLRGARLVKATETESGRRWDEAKVKALTGGDRIAARFMRQDFFEFTPTFKLIVSGNHKPGLRSVDEAIRRRLRIVPFTVTIPERDRDDELRAKLEAESGGILAWAIEGAAEWAMQGLRPPPAVYQATERYLEAEDLLRQFIDQACRVGGEELWAMSSVLYQRWCAFCEANGERHGSAKWFSQRLEAAGFEKRRSGKGVRFIGIQTDADAEGPSV